MAKKPVKKAVAAAPEPVREETPVVPAVPMAPPPPQGIPLQLVILIVGGVALVSGWMFILWHHHFHLSASAVMLMLGWTAVLSSVYFLWRTADNTDLDDQEDWWRPAGRIEELVREKRSLLKAIKETELDRDTGKLSMFDANDILSRYRRRAIEVIKAIDEAEGGEGGVRAKIEREVRARLEIDGAGEKAVAKRDARKKAFVAPASAPAAVTETAAATEAATETAPETAAAAETDAIVPPPSDDSEAAASEESAS
jgi:hypothetical protein